ncbi:hypothetical protein KHDHEBDM_01111 [Pectobacterium polaris]|nr:hypothetical protein KHDHEBDM_01111 [Pectobacterium polaris]
MYRLSKVMKARHRQVQVKPLVVPVLKAFFYVYCTQIYQTVTSLTYVSFHWTSDVKEGCYLRWFFCLKDLIAVTVICISNASQLMYNLSS